MGLRPPPGPPKEAGAANYRLFRSDPIRFLESVGREFGDVARFHLGETPYVLVNSPTLAREVLTRQEQHLAKPEFMKSSNRGHWGDGLTTLEGEQWRSRRRLLRPSFTRGALQEHLECVQFEARSMLGRWPNEGPLDLHREVRLHTARCAARFVVDAHMCDDEAPSERPDHLPHRELFGEDFTGTPGGDARAPIRITRPRAPRDMSETITLMESRIASGERRRDVLSDLVRGRLASGPDLSSEQIIGELVQMLYAGHHTVPAVMTTMWRHMHEHPAVAREVRLEARSRPGKARADDTFLMDSYACAVVKESMRMEPPAPVLYREVVDGFRLGEFDLAADDGLWISPQLLHFDPRNFPDPHIFDPGRFRGATASPIAYLPFGLGPRTCIGNRLSLLQMTLTLLEVEAGGELAPSGEGGVFGFRRTSVV